MGAHMHLEQIGRMSGDGRGFDSLIRKRGETYHTIKPRTNVEESIRNERVQEKERETRSTLLVICDNCYLLVIARLLTRDSYSVDLNTAN